MSMSNAMRQRSDNAIYGVERMEGYQYYINLKWVVDTIRYAADEGLRATSINLSSEMAADRIISFLSSEGFQITKEVSQDEASPASADGDKVLDEVTILVVW